MIVTLFAFSKKKNSTAQPNPADGTNFTVDLKEETSVMYPVLIFDPASSGMPVPFVPSVFNYAQIVNWSRYYFISDWRWLNGRWEATLSIDVLATYRAGIGNESAYIERSASAFNGNIIDRLYPAKTDVQISHIAVTNGWAGVAPSGGCYILGVINKYNWNHIGSVMYYAMTTTELNSLLQFMYSNNIYQSESITEFGEGVFKSLFNPFQYIVSCHWMPSPPTTYGSYQAPVFLGYWDTGVQTRIVDSLLEVKTVTATLPDHPQISRGAFLNHNPFTRITLFCPPFGEIPIDATFLRTGKYLHCQCVVDVITGQATLRVSFSATSDASYSGKPCIEKTALYAVPIQLAQVLSDYSGSVSTLANSITGGISGILSGLIGATVDSALATQSPKVMTDGANGSFISVAMPPEIVVEHTLLADEDNADLGRPLMAQRTINTLSGYVKCAESHFSGVCLDEEKKIIDDFLVNGFFYE